MRGKRTPLVAVASKRVHVSKRIFGRPAGQAFEMESRVMARSLQVIATVIMVMRRYSSC
jgi:hypothetical protein